VAQSPFPRSWAGSGSGAGLGLGQFLTRAPERGPGGTSQSLTGATSVEPAQKSTTFGRLLPGAVVAASVNGGDEAQRSLRLTGKRWGGSELDSSPGGGHFAGAAWSWEGGPRKWAVGLCPGEEGDGAPRGGARQGAAGGVTVKRSIILLSVQLLSPSFSLQLHSLTCKQTYNASSMRPQKNEQTRNLHCSRRRMTGVYYLP
jgi:hypothetical protein